MSWLHPHSGLRSRMSMCLGLALALLLLSRRIMNGEPSSAAASPKPLETELVFAAMQSTDMSWVDEHLSDRRVSIYRADGPPEANLTVPVNKGDEAMVYLTFLVDRYWTLPDVTIFLHGGRYQWHNDNPLYDSVISIRDLNLDFVLEAGYVNLRCAWAVGCPAELEPARYYRERPDDPLHSTAMVYPDQFLELFPGVQLPEVVGVPCCSQFAVSREAIQSRSREDYVRIRQWLIDSTLQMGTSGRVLEYMWHILFGKSPRYCLDPQTCYCETYGHCDMNEEQLKSQWVWRGLVLPKGWPDAVNETN
ncbi:hypothetical protein NUU61_001688 [Penicillium alfredii]|uniref:Uncharacterized protein n=1 Tax=Penicillium alfredii TaxID=1506179 RepID=A0A9W9KFY3_9EURO|nr:uncharacterized protein NUU61_001688 [Penicillium alfredii]KAJ5104341.1 hypothetical protein NUU61_001688 [Penicillium alfredii]